MHTFQMSFHVSKNGVLSITLPNEWADKEVNILLVLESLQQVLPAYQTNLTIIFDLLAQMPDDFMNERLDTFDTVEWNNGLDLDPEYLYKNSCLVKEALCMQTS